FITIDGEDAKDFDDAVCCEKQAKGWRLWVAIADVSHYVKPGSALDIEAQKRGTSVYFPGYVVPMLPEEISNGLCSLNPKVDRLVMVCEMTINASGKITSYQFSEAVIHSHARLTYTQVNALLTTPDSNLGKRMQKEHSDLVPWIHELYKLYGTLSKARSARGFIDFNTRETRFQFNKKQKIEKILPVERNEAHKLIEECMLCANVAAARFLKKAKLPALYRNHDGPQPNKLKNLRSFLVDKNIKLSGGKKPTPIHYDQVLQQANNRADANAIQSMMLRSLSQAQYSTVNQGHFGLAYSEYAHFTSPIRRYPDLLVHRAIRSVIRKKKNPGNSTLQRILKSVTGLGSNPAKHLKDVAPQDSAINYPYDAAYMKALANQCSLLSRRADKASWDVDAWLKCEYIQASIGKTFTGTVIAVTRFGLFVELDDTKIEGLIHINSLKKDYYHFDENKQQLKGERSNATYTIGDKVCVGISRVDMDAKKIELELKNIIKN
ncbi:MAG: ribonuclease R, partial [Gammaproteobacteria bacterium]